MTAPPSSAADLLGAAGARDAGSNAPLLLDDLAMAWKVVGGRLDVFVVPVRAGAIDGPREFLFHAETGDLLFGFGMDASDSVSLIAVGGTDGAVAPVPLEEFRAFTRDHPDAAAAIIDRHLRNVSFAFGEHGAPRIDLMPDGDGEISFAASSVLGGRRDATWIEVKNGGALILGDQSLPLTRDEPPFPLTTGGWITADPDGGTVRAHPCTTSALIDDDRIWSALQAFQQTVVAWGALVLTRDIAARLAQLNSRIAADDGTRREALSAMASVMTSSKVRADRKKGVPLLAAMEMVGAAQGIRFRAPTQPLNVVDQYGAARAVAQTSSVGQRRVLLSSGWWTRDVGPLLGFLEMRQLKMTGSIGGHDDTELVPLALLPTGRGSYEMVNPETGSRSLVNEELAQHIAAFGVQFYRGLPTSKLRVADLWRFVVFGLARDTRIIVAVGAAGAFLGLVLPLLTGYLFDDVIPSADRSALFNVMVALIVATLSSLAFELTRAIAVVRLHTRLTSALQMAVIDRLLRLPTTFFRKYSAGDLGRRALGVNTIGKQLGGATISAILSSVVSGSSFVLLFYYSVPLALLATGILLLNIVISVVVSRITLVFVREHEEASGKLAGLVLQLLDGIAKLRVSAGEARAFARWSNAFRRQQEVAFRVGLFTLSLNVFYAMLRIFSKLATYWMYAWLAERAGGGLSTGQFLAFSAASGAFISAGLDLSGTAISMLDLLPTWERARPLLDTEPEVDILKPDPGVLTGRIEVNQVSFAYAKDGPQILHDVSLEVKPGEFVALVGPSGSGKSTLLRILLGFEKQQTGAVRFDGHELTAVDVTAVRRQIGVVLQNSSLTSGDIFSNIVGASALTIDDAWEAARMAGMEDDLQAMPMGMHTVVSEGGGALSGGQRQRLLIARALVTRPRILFFDEATSALDNRTQRIVSESVDALHATRVVVAHRLSTIRNADRIFVMSAGRLVESGSYAELMELGGLFASMAARQEA